jgi:O-antigen/teichoic acid export membrane protein
MGMIKRQGILNTLVSYTGIGIGFINAALLFPNFLSPEELGLTRIFVQAIMMLVQFSTLGLNNSIVRFFPFYRDPKLNNNKFLWLISGLAIVGILGSIVLLLLGKPLIISIYQDKSPLLVSYFYLIIPLGISYHFFNVFAAWSKAVYRTVLPNIMQEVVLRLLHTASILLLYLDIVDFHQFMLLFVGSYAISWLLLMLVLAILGELRYFPVLGNIRIKSLRFILKFGFYSMFSGITNTLTLTFDSLMLGAIIGLRDVGIYTTAVYFTSIMMVSAKTFYRVTAPVVADYWKEDKKVGLNRLYKNVSLINTLAGGFLFVLIWANLDELFSFMPEAYLAGKWVFFFYGLGRLFDLFGGINGVILVNSPKYKWETYSNLIFCLSMVGLNLIFIPNMGMTGAAVATLISIGIFNIIRMALLYHYYKFHPFHPKIWLSFLIVGGLFFLYRFIPKLGSPILDIVLTSAILSLLFGGAVYFSGLYKLFLEPGKDTSKKEQS